jgi:hypothetical protein
VALGALCLLLAACGALRTATVTPEPTCEIVPQATGEKWIPIVRVTPPPSYAYAGQTIQVSFSGGYLVGNNAVVCGAEGIVDYVHSDELPGWRDVRTVAFQLGDQRFGERTCAYDCTITGTIPGAIDVGVYPLYVLAPVRLRELAFELFIVPSPTP